MRKPSIFISFFICILSCSINPIFSQESTSVESPMPKQEMEYFYSVFSDSTYLAPTSFQTETLQTAELIYGVTMGWRPDQPSEDELKMVTEKTWDHYQDLISVYPTIKTVVTNDNKFNVVSVPENINATVGLLGLWMIEVENQSTSTLNLEPIIKEFGATGRAPVMVNSGDTLPILLPIAFNGMIDSVTLNIFDHGSSGLALETSVPVKVHQPVKVSGKAGLASTKEAFPSRVYALGSDGIYRHAMKYASNTTLSEKPVVFRPAMYKIPFFYTEGNFEVFLPPDEATFTVERGFETQLVSESVELKEGQPATVEVFADRDHDMMSKGWISGDTHIHWVVNSWNINEDLELLEMVQRAEDLRVANNLTLYQYLPDGKSFTKPDQHPMGTVEESSDEQYHIEMGEEFRNDEHFGHINLLNLTELITPVATGKGSGGPEGTFDWPTNKMVIEEARRQGGISIEAHNLGPFNSSGVTVNLISGYSDSIDQLDPEHYYDFLNSGIKIGLSNGSDHPARLAGISRVYVNSGTSIDYDAWCDALASGKTFTTSGPLIQLTVNDAEIGDTIKPEKGSEINVTATVWSRYPIGNFEIIRNGEIVADVETNGNEAVLHFTTTADESQWFTARCSRSDDYNAANTPDVAHTSAVYVEIDGKPVLKTAAIQKWITNIQLHRKRLVDTGNFEKPEQKQEALDFIDHAAGLFNELLKQSMK